MAGMAASEPRYLLRTTGRILHILFAAGILFSMSYVMGHTMLGGGLKGDGAMHVGYAEWLDRYFPRIPHWFPLQGGGESLLHGYPIFPHLLLVVVRRLSGLSILQAFRLISFLGFPLTALGVYLFGWTSQKSQTQGLVAAILFLLAPVTWTWAYDWGFFSQQVAMIFLPLALVAFDRTMKAHLVRPKKASRRHWFVVFAIFTALAMISHMIIGAAIAAGVSIYVVAATALAPRGARRIILREGLKIILLLGLVVGLLLAAYIVPFYAYGKYANREGLNDLPPQMFHRLPFLEFFGLERVDLGQILTRMQFPLPVVAFGLVGAIFSLSRRKREGRPNEAAVWALVAIAAVIFSLSPALVALVQKAWPLLVNFLNFRSLLALAMVLVPLAAAHGVWALAKVLVHAIAGAAGRYRGPAGFAGSGSPTGYVVATMVTFLIAWAGIFPLPGLASSEPWLRDYGPKRMDLRDIWDRRADDVCASPNRDTRVSAFCSLPEARAQLNIQEFFLECDRIRDLGFEGPSLCTDPTPSYESLEAFLAECEAASSLGQLPATCHARVGSGLEQLALEHWPAFLLTDDDPLIARSQQLASWLPDDHMLRIDISPYLGRLAQDLTTYSGTSQIEAYSQQLSLIHLVWGYQLGVFYSNEYGSPEALDDLADWMGIEYVFLDPSRDPIGKYDAANWELISGNEAIQLRHNPEAPPMATATTKPSILVVGAPSKGVYFQVFRLANEGLAHYGEFVIVEGSGRVDDYSLEELQRFDILLLHGYEYKNSKEAWGLLEQYVRGGGSLFVDTGWQFEIPEWEFEQAPEVLPVNSLSWTNYGKQTEYALEHIDIAGDVDPTQFGPLVWEEDAWSVSGAGRTDVRDWGQTILSVRDQPLIVAGELDQGRVVWSGMNLISHLIAYDSEEEILLLRNLLDWLTERTEGTEIAPPLVVREHPDNISFSLAPAAGNLTWLYWREAYYPNWHAYLIDGTGRREVPIYRGGPGFMLMPIETASQSASVQLVWEPSPSEKGAVIGSFVGLAVLVGLLADGLLLGGSGFTWLKIAVTLRVPAPFLGEGSNLNWAERKRAEIELGQVDLEPRTYQPEEAIPRLPTKGTMPQAKQLVNRDGRDEALGFPAHFSASEGEEDLLRTWVENTGHQDDAWAKKLLRRRIPSKRE